MTWNELYAAFFDLQGRRCMVQVQGGIGEQPVLSAIGRFEGGPSGEWAGSDTIIIGLAAGKGNAGSVMLQEQHFEDFEQLSPNHLTVCTADFGFCSPSMTAPTRNSASGSPRRTSTTTSSAGPVL